MLNFYKFYNKTGLDNEHYDPLIEQLYQCQYTLDLQPIEHIIKKNPDQACCYARNILNGRWLEAEPYIMKDPEVAMDYAIHTMKERWLDAEPYIVQDDWCWLFYTTMLKIC